MVQGALDGGQNTISDLLWMALDNTVWATPTAGSSPGSLLWKMSYCCFPLRQRIYYSDYGSPSLKAIVCKEVYRISLAQDSIQIFTAGSLVVFLWRLSVLATSSYNRMPEVSAFPDLGLVSKIPEKPKDEGLREVSTRLRNRDIARAVSRVRVSLKDERVMRKRSRGLNMRRLMIFRLLITLFFCDMPR
jgi:hypothetical protein